jgi:hypothetical protein
MEEYSYTAINKFNVVLDSIRVLDLMPLRGGYLIKEHWEVGEMPLKITYLVLAKFDLKNTRRSYHNGGSWPG